MNFYLFWKQEEDDYGKTKQWSAARLTRSATLPRKSRVAGSSYLACSSGGGGSSCSQPDKTPAPKKTYPSSGSSGYNSLPRMNGGRKFGGGKNSPSELSYKMTAAKAAIKAAAAEEDRDAGKPDTPTGRGSNFDSSYSCDEISVNNCSIALTATPPPPVKAAKTAADLRREYFRGSSKFGSTTAAGKDQQFQQKQHSYFNRSGNGGMREKQAIASSLQKYFDNACKIK